MRLRPFTSQTMTPNSTASPPAMRVSIRSSTSVKACLLLTPVRESVLAAVRAWSRSLEVMLSHFFMEE